MKRFAILFVLFLFCATLLFSWDEPGGMKMGIQMSSDSYLGVLVYSNRLDLSLKGRLIQGDGASAYANSGELSVGGHIGYNLHPFHDETAVSVGAELINTFGTGDLEYAENVNGGLRLGVNYPLGEHFLISGLLYPVYISTLETDSIEWGLTALFPKAVLAAAILF